MTESKTSPISKILSLVAKTGISILFVVWLLRQTTWAELSSLWLTVVWQFVLGSLALYFLGLLISTWRWQLIARAKQFREPLPALYRYGLIGSFFNLFLPSSLGGDVIKSYYLAKDPALYRTALGTVIVDRVSGLAILTVALGAEILLIDFPRLPPILNWVSVGASIIVLLILVLLPLITYWLGKILSQSWLAVWAENYRWLGRLWLPIACLALISQIPYLVMYQFIAQSLGVNLAPNFLIMFYTSYVLITALPISLSGIGLREGVAVYFFSQLGLPISVGIAFGLIHFTILLIAGLMGGVVYLIVPRDQSALLKGRTNAN